MIFIGCENGIKPDIFVKIIPVKKCAIGHEKSLIGHENIVNTVNSKINHENHENDENFTIAVVTCGS